MQKAKVPLQVYLSREDRDDYNAICKARGISAAQEMRTFIKRKLKENKELLK